MANQKIDIRATEKITICLELVLGGTLSLYVVFGQDGQDYMQTKDFFYKDGVWRSSSGCELDPDDIVKRICKKMVWHGLMEKTVQDFVESEAVGAAVRDADLHVLSLTVMGS